MEQRFPKDRPRRLLTGTIVLGALLLATIVSAAETHVLANGLTVTIHGPKELLARCESADGAVTLHHPGLGDLELLSGPADVRLPRADVDAFVPLEAAEVLAALEQVDARVPDLDVDVLLLPAPPVRTLGSFSTRNLIVLSPGFGPAAPATVHWLTVHELGHVLTWACFDRTPDAWDRYRDLRGLDPVRNGGEASHHEREREILAEDLRYLYGGALATADGTIENHHLVTPDRVAGLADHLDDVLADGPGAAPVLRAGAWPNPCNPRTTVELRLPAGETIRDAGAAVLEILDSRGRRVRLIRGGRLVNGSLQVEWDGTGATGVGAATGRYFYRIGWPGLQARGALTLIR